MPEMDELIEWLKAHVPADDGVVTLTHGDFRLDNIVFHPTEPRVLALLDWELCSALRIKISNGSRHSSTAAFGPASA